MAIKIGMEELQYINIFQDITKITPRDCVILGDVVVFVVDDDKVGAAIGKNGETVEKVKKVLKNKKVSIVGYTPDLGRFVQNILRPVEVLGIEKEGNTLKIFVKKDEYRRAIGNQGKRLARIETLLERHFNIPQVKLVAREV